MHLRFGQFGDIYPPSHFTLVFCECSQVIIHKGDTDLAYEISLMYRESRQASRPQYPRTSRPLTVLGACRGWRMPTPKPSAATSRAQPQADRLQEDGMIAPRSGALVLRNNCGNKRRWREACYAPLLHCCRFVRATQPQLLTTLPSP